LNLTLLVGAQHQRVFGRVEIQTDDVFQFLCEGCIVADLEGFHTMRFQTVSAPDTPHAGFADAHCRRHGARAPVRGVGRLLAHGQGHHTFRQAGADGGCAAGTGRVFLQSRHTQREETLAPSRSFLRRHGHAGGDFQILLTGSREQHDASALRHSHWQGSAPGLAFQDRPLLRTQCNGRGFAHPQPSPLIIRRVRIDKGC
jgi:hypothetical protein